ncbi:hypothetical protein FA15DRAFT_445387 [Coprinopsis marcescibilis]|uniref:HMG box domain-containing protein n=1 Tax=Coprinopsis marcescibilis TaxID=230819 RepID=A0A5C3L6D4_COPMA|nr:hypothetical protein FA15DRAFT_445387 [Coprinopsis marcescibilis]
MPALRSGPALMPFPRSRRRSSHLSLFTPAKAGIYGVGIQQHYRRSPSPPPLPTIPQRPISFAPNVTPVTFVESDSSSPSTPEPQSPNSLPKLFPPSEVPAPPPARKRCPPGKRRSQGYIPRPPNAFMLFRADFVRQKHVPGSIETNHGSLSKIIGNCWRNLPLEEKKVWEQRAKHEKAAHKIQYPNYRFRPVHNKNKKKADNSNDVSLNAGDEKKKHEVTQEEEMRCEEVTQLLLEGMKGEDLARAVRQRDELRKQHAKAKAHAHHGIPHQLTMPPRQVAFGNGIMSAPQPTYPANSVLGGSSNAGFLNSGETSYLHLRRSSSVPLPGVYTNGGFDFNNFQANFGQSMDFWPAPPPYSEGISMDDHSDQGMAIPSVPFLPPPSSSGITGLANSSLNSDGHLSIDDSNININSAASISKQHQRMLLGHRRSSSAGPAFGGIQRAWNGQFNNNYGFGYFAGGDEASGDIVLQRDTSPLPEADLSLFDPSFFSHSNGGSQGTPAPEDHNAPTSRTNPGTTQSTPSGAFNVTELLHGLQPNNLNHLGPLDTTGIPPSHIPISHNEMMSPHDMVSPADSFWSNNSGNSQQQQQGLGLQVVPNDVGVDGGAVSSGANGQNFDQMYMTDQNQHAGYMGMDMFAGANANAGQYGAGQYEYGPLDMGMGGAQYVEC